jgi:hypothetical protein
MAMLTKASFVLVAVLVIASTSSAFAVASRLNFDVQNSTFSFPDGNEESRLDQTKSGSW